MTRRRFVLVTYFYPPHGGAGVQRALHLSRLAPALGWDPIVLACGTRGQTPIDETLVPKIPPGARVERTHMMSLEPLRRVLRTLRLGTLMRAIPADDYVGWLPFAMRRADAIRREESFDLVVSTSSPYTAHLVAGRLARAAGCPWIADLRDPWTDNRFLPIYRDEDRIARFRQRVDGRLEQSMYDAAAAVTVTAGPLRTLLIERHGLSPNRVHLIRNGFDADDFPAPYADSAPRPRGEKFRLVFGGNIYGDYNLSAVFRAAELLLSRRAVPELVVEVVTPAKNWVEREAPKYPHLQPRIDLRPPVPHDQVVDLYRSADVLVLCSLDALSIPAKFYEYVAAGPPVLAFVAPDTDTERLLAETGAGTAVPTNDAEQGALAIERLYEAWKRGDTQHRSEAAIAGLSRQEKAREFVRLFDAVTAR